MSSGVRRKGIDTEWYLSDLGINSNLTTENWIYNWTDTYGMEGLNTDYKCVGSMCMRNLFCAINHINLNKTVFKNINIVLIFTIN